MRTIILRVPVILVCLLGMALVVNSIQMVEGVVSELHSSSDRISAGTWLFCAAVGYVTVVAVCSLLLIASVCDIRDVFQTEQDNHNEKPVP